MVDRTIELPFLEESMAQTVPGKKVIGPYRGCFLIMRDRVVDPFLLKESIGQSHLSIWIVWLHPDRFIAIQNCLVHFAFAQKSSAEVVIGIPKAGLHFQGRPVMRN